MRRLTWLALLAPLSLALAVPASAQEPKPGRDWYEDAVDLGFRVKAPDGWSFVPPQPGVCDGKPGIKNIAKHVQIVTREKGAICGATPVPGKKQILEDTASNEAVEKDLPTQAQEAAPPLCMEGLDVLNKLVPCTSPSLFTIETNGKPEFRDFLGVACSTN